MLLLSSIGFLMRLVFFLLFLAVAVAVAIVAVAVVVVVVVVLLPMLSEKRNEYCYV